MNIESDDIAKADGRDRASYSKKPYPGVEVCLLMYLLFSFSWSMGRVAFWR